MDSQESESQDDQSQGNDQSQGSDQSQEAPTFDASQYPNLDALAQAGSFDGWLAGIGAQDGGDYDAGADNAPPEVLTSSTGPQRAPATDCGPEKTSMNGAAAQLATAWLALGIACAPSLTVWITCPLAIAAVVSAYWQLKGAQEQYDRCMRPKQRTAEADALGAALAAMEAEIGQLEAFKNQFA